MLKRILNISGLLIVSTSALLKGSPVSYGDQIQDLSPLATDRLELELAEILQLYYSANFGNSLSWKQIQSIQFTGKFRTENQDLGLTILKRKPNLVKVTLFFPNDHRRVMSFDGTDAWQKSTLEALFKRKIEVESMPEGEARNFIRDAPFGGSLVYPHIQGKTIRYEGIANVAGRNAYHLSVILPDDQIIESFIDYESHEEIRRITVNNVNGNRETTDYSDYRRIDGMNIPFKSVLTIDGNVVHKISIERVSTNPGIHSIVFTRPSGSDENGHEFWAIPKALNSEPSLLFKGEEPQIQDNESWSSFQSIDSSAFEDTETQRIIDDIGKPTLD